MRVSAYPAAVCSRLCSEDSAACLQHNQHTDFMRVDETKPFCMRARLHSTSMYMCVCDRLPSLSIHVGFDVGALPSDDVQSLRERRKQLSKQIAVVKAAGAGMRRKSRRHGNFGIT
jgi:hypothetical protein